MLVESGDSDLLCLNPDGELTDKWKIEVESYARSATADHRWSARAGLRERHRAQRRSADGRDPQDRRAAGQLDSGPIAVGNQWVLVTWDGSLISLARRGRQP